MKKIVFLLAAVIGLSSCEEEISFNDPAFQGMKDDVLWRAGIPTAVLNTDGSLTFKGDDDFGYLDLTVESPTVGTYVLGQDNINTVKYKFDADGMVLNYATAPGVGNGEVVITKVETNNKGVTLISGNFKFNAYLQENNPFGNPILNFNKGVIYKVPVVSAAESVE